MDFFGTITLILLYESPPFSIILFLLSALLLVAGVAVKTWKEAYYLGGIETQPLNWIEQTHPHLPSPRVIGIIALCSATLLIVALQTHSDIFPFNDPYHGLNLTTLFLLCAAVGSLAELKWRGSREYMLSFLEGTAIAFLVRLLLSLPGRSIDEKVIIFLLLAASITMIEATLVRARKRGVIMVMVFSFAFWAAVWFVALPR
ncbi:MAG TPA: hypothetical protein VJB82_02980 [Candidatus Peribacterales bacterium]|nr:hypothetical protein [Candidatus Peribacterales bacterium]